MKRLFIILFACGLFLGIGQLFLIRDITKQKVEKINRTGMGQTCQAISPECGECTAEERNGYCYFPPYTQKFRGFPFTSGSYGYDSRTNITSALLVNTALFVVGLPLLGICILRVKDSRNK